jgi:hypothetical protein
MKDIIIRNENASHRFIRNYMAAHDIADLNSLKHEGVDINHGSRRRPCNINAIPVDLRGDKPSQPASDRLTFQPFSTLALV